MSNPTSFQSNPTSFQIGRQVGESFAPTIERQKDIGAIDDIFAQMAERGEEGNFDDLMGQIASRVSPQNQKAAMGLLVKKKEQFMEQQSQGAYKSLAANLRKVNPDSQLYDSLASVYESDIPTDQKDKIAKNINEALPFKLKQQHRLDQQHITNTYKTWIKEKEEEIKSARYGDRPKLQEELKELKKERDLAINLDPFKPSEKEAVTEKIQFNPQDPQHLEIYEKLKVEFNGDKEKINAALSEKFTG